MNSFNVFDEVQWKTSCTEVPASSSLAIQGLGALGTEENTVEVLQVPADVELCGTKWWM
jgi:hypothetical protein